MTYRITEKCIECGSCAKFCKKQGIDYIDHRYVIDEAQCDSCGTCLEYCPIDDAIVESEPAPQKQALA